MNNEINTVIHNRACGGAATSMPQEATNLPQNEWFVLRVTYQRELQAKALLDKLDIDSFVPVHTVRRRNAQGREYIARVPLLHNYIFVYADKATVKSIKTEHIPYMRYVMHIQNGENCMMTVPDEQMRNFIAIAGSDDQRIMLLPADTADLSKGTKVRITGGPFGGVEGVFMKVDGARDRRVVVKIEGVVAVATASIPLELIEKTK